MFTDLLQVHKKVLALARGNGDIKNLFTQFNLFADLFCPLGNEQYLMDFVLQRRMRKKGSGVSGLFKKKNNQSTFPVEPPCSHQTPFSW